jgi:hypothetical protein
MAGNLQIYAVVYITIENALITQEASATLRYQTGSQPVLTTPLGYAGESPGAAMCEMEIESAVPFAAVEYDPTRVIGGLIPVEIGYLIGGKTLKSKGFIYEVDYRHAVNQEAKQSLRFRGRPPKLE